MPFTRRKFLNQTSKALGSAALLPLMPAPLTAFSSRRSVPAADKIRIALIGANSMGFGDLENALKQPGVECIGLCDVDDAVLTRRNADILKMQGRPAKQYKDFRKLLEDKDIDAVIIGTPDHWHCLPFIAACEAGKDIYVEKPLANSIGECDLMVKAARKYTRVVQVGQQQRSGAHWKQAMDFMNAGHIGTLRKVNIWGNFNYGVGGKIVPDSPVPPGVDFEMWLGPAPERTFNKNRFHGNWRMFWDYGGGLMTDWGVHLRDRAVVGKNSQTTPLTVTATGGNFSFPDHAHETFDTMSVSYQMKDYTINWDHVAGTELGPYNRSYGLAYIGDYATLVIDRDGWELFPGKDGAGFRTPAIPRQPGKDSHEEHMVNFLECIKTRKDPACTIENGRLVAMYAHMGNIALRTNSRLEWQASAHNFGTNEKANALITPVYRAPWKL